MEPKKDITIFIVEDNEIYLKALEGHLKEKLKSNVTIHTYLNGEDCLSNMNLKPQIIILDYFLDSASEIASNGLEILKKVKKIDPKVAVVMLSGQDNSQVASDTMQYGAYYYVSKNESAFLRIQNAIFNIYRTIHHEAQLKKSKKVQMLMLVWIIVIILAVIVIFKFFPNLIRA